MNNRLAILLLCFVPVGLLAQTAYFPKNAFDPILLAGLETADPSLRSG